jgi:hypothetical protein
VVYIEIWLETSFGHPVVQEDGDRL